MAQIDNGPASGNGVVYSGVGTGIEFHVPSGIDPLGPAQAPYVGPQAATNQDVPGTKNSATNATNTTVNFGTLGTGIKFSLPA